ncbi:hypothetical protein [Mesorhizobium tamadayense]|nr:hypothetical protein [Mesorhizobium tamadayense]
MADLTFAFVYYFGLTGGDVLGAVVSLAAGLLLYNVMREDQPNR